MNYYRYWDSPVGQLTIRCSDHALTGLWLRGQAYYPDLKSAILQPDHPILCQTVNWLSRYFRGDKPDIDQLLLEQNGTPFQMRVWNALLEIPYGQTASYRDIAEHINAPKAYQAVGAAVGRNPISIVIPCHRVIGSNGSLTGFAGGLAAKNMLLIHEHNTK